MYSSDFSSGKIKRDRNEPNSEKLTWLQSQQRVGS